MPYLTERIALNDPFLDRRVKLIPCQKERVLTMYYEEGRSVKVLAKIFHVNKRLIQFILFPERLEEIRIANHLRKPTSDGFTIKAINEHRKYKHTLREILLNGQQQSTPDRSSGHTGRKTTPDKL